MEREGILNEFLKGYLEDRERGQVRTLKDYQARFPGIESQIAEEYARLSLGETRENGAQFYESEFVGSRLGDFRILREIGRGGMGVVYLAEQISLRRKVALKVLPAHLTLTERHVESFHREANTAAKLQHPGVVPIYLVGEERGTQFFAMEYIEGGSLHHALEVAREYRSESGSNEPERLNLLEEKSHSAEAAEIAAQVAEVLAYAHSQGIFHRDIKPQNILIDVGGKPKLVDFGLAKDVQQESLSVSGELAGTPNYMSPEQVTAKRIKIDHRTDIFSLGVVLYEILTLERPFRGDTAQQVMSEITFKEPRSIRTLNRRVPRDLETVCLKALEKDPDRRYQDAGSMAADLRSFLRLEPIVAKPAGPITKTWKWTRRHRSFTAAVALILIFSLILVGVRSWQIRTEWSRFESAVREAELHASGERYEYALASILEALAIRPDDAVAKSRYETYRKSLELRAVQSERDLKEDALQEIKRLSDVVDVRDLVANADKLWPRRPERIPDMRSWLERAQEIYSRLPEYEEILLRIHAEATLAQGLAGTDSEGVTPELNWEIADTDVRYRHQVSLELVERIRGLDKLIAHVGKRLEIASSIRKQSIDDHAADWDEAINEIALSDKYGGLEITPQLGLVPIGLNQDSGLFEFLVWESGEQPERDLEANRFVIKEETGIVLVLLPGGTFWMGSQSRLRNMPNLDPEVDSFAMVRKVSLKPFFLSKYELTRAQWNRFAGTLSPLKTAEAISLESMKGLFGFIGGLGDASKKLEEYHENHESKSFLDLLLGDGTTPVSGVRFEDAHRTLFNYELRLPSESEWEYGVRAGTTTPWWSGQSKELISDRNAGNIADLCLVTGNSVGIPASLASLWPVFLREINVERCEQWNDKGALLRSVGSYSPNQFGLHDVIGNVSEWCDLDSVMQAQGEFGFGAERGGSYRDLASYARSSYRKALDSSPAWIGIRAARPVTP